MELSILILTGKMTFLQDEFLAKVVCFVDFGVLTIQPAVRLTLGPPRLQLLTSWTAGIMTGKMTF